jgi:hypothetical protein
VLELTGSSVGAIVSADLNGLVITVVMKQIARIAAMRTASGAPLIRR